MMSFEDFYENYGKFRERQVDSPDELKVLYGMYHAFSLLSNDHEEFLLAQAARDRIFQRLYLKPVLDNLDLNPANLIER